jgi:hypothetical protein
LLAIEKQLVGALDLQLLKPERHCVKIGKMENGVQVWLFNESILLGMKQRGLLGSGTK